MISNLLNVSAKPQNCEKAGVWLRPEIADARAPLAADEALADLRAVV